MNAVEIIKKAENIVLNEKTRSAWGSGVNAYAYDLLFDLEDADLELSEIESPATLRKILLNGADSWEQYSWGGCSLIYNFDIAQRLCTTSELKRTHEGDRRPNSREEWLDTQARALFQAAEKVVRIIVELTANN